MEFDSNLFASRSHLDPVRLADTLKLVHRIPASGLDSAELDPFSGLERGINTAYALDVDDRRWLHLHLAELRGRWKGLPDGRSRCVIHGTIGIDGVLTGADDCAEPPDSGSPTVGPPEWDLVPVAMAYWSFGWLTTPQYVAFCQTYGQDVARSGRYYLLRDIQEFAMTIAAARTIGNGRHRSQAARRLASIRGDIGPRPWPGWVPI
ncbi:hypothetical protein [Nocardia sp. CDC160]|uniref:hypothetical protein n=1 Tax=Nocardia sp. CDC160 TaxID=3112166 RepID=UPI002DB7D572|nr:hypothetical protein [Nocardia sp. CDC160]MEC3917475.1 hypothetical protein [Nocardia sp. CDC160]